MFGNNLLLCCRPPLVLAVHARPASISMITCLLKDCKEQRQPAGIHEQDKSSTSALGYAMQYGLDDNIVQLVRIERHWSLAIFTS